MRGISDNDVKKKLNNRCVVGWKHATDNDNSKWRKLSQ